MELTDLNIFKTVVDEGGIIRAARALHRVPSNVSARIKQLERSIGTHLFFRGNQRLTITPQGEVLLVYAQRLLRLSEEARAALRTASPGGVLKLGSLESTAAGLLPAILAAYHRAFPEVRIELTTGTNDAMLAAVNERQIEAAFVAEAPAGSRHLSVLPLFKERLVLISSVAHRPIRSAKDLREDSLISFPAGCAYRRAFERWLGRTSLSMRRVLEMSSYHSIVACVAAGAGVALVPESVLSIVDDRHILRHTIPRAHQEFITPLVWRTHEASRALIALVDFLKAIPGPSSAAPIRTRRKGGLTAAEGAVSGLL